ncbi:hypothetical protein EB837_25450 [Kluyvera ascorbata]|uniref:Uncharacterized protein n=1 Tax=Kluyvera ascorbata TaxID=51288 RepID=A0A3N2RNZ0_9ENTR|nr:hypothetical protein [Kluyvera ascorbata]ROU09185.1 hypothetical protein EB837_25450 [Kluyvera ascorbata]
MPQNTPVNTVLPLISSPRLGSYIVTFKPADDHELYGTYIWSQLASGSVYPLLQNLEITLRNAIDTEARKRFGDKWWDNPRFHCGKDITQTAFYGKILRAIDNRKRAARTVLTGMCYSVGSATRQGSSSPTRFIGQSAMTSRT